MGIKLALTATVPMLVARFALLLQMGDQSRVKSLPKPRAAIAGPNPERTGATATGAALVAERAAAVRSAYPPIDMSELIVTINDNGRKGFVFLEN